MIEVDYELTQELLDASPAGTLIVHKHNRQKRHHVASTGGWKWIGDNSSIADLRVGDLHPPYWTWAREEDMPDLEPIPADKYALGTVYASPDMRLVACTAMLNGERQWSIVESTGGAPPWKRRGWRGVIPGTWDYLVGGHELSGAESDGGADVRWTFLANKADLAHFGGVLLDGKFLNPELTSEIAVRVTDTGFPDVQFMWRDSTIVEVGVGDFVLAVTHEVDSDNQTLLTIGAGEIEAYIGLLGPELCNELQRHLDEVGFDA